MPVYNASSYLVPALDSILNQTYRNWELIAVDDTSTDDSYLILKQYSQIDSRIKCFKNIENIGVGKTLDKGVKLATGDFIARMDADDISMSDRLAKQVGFLVENPNVVALGGQCVLIDEKGKVIGTKNFPLKNKALYEMLYSATPIQHPTLIINKSLLPADFTWYDGWKKAQDIYLFYKLVAYGELANLPDYVLYYRYYRGGNSLKNPKDTFRLTNKIRYIAKTKLGYKPTLRSRCLNLAQFLLVSVLPNFMIFSLYKFVRGLLRVYNSGKSDYSADTYVQTTVPAKAKFASYRAS